MGRKNYGLLDVKLPGDSRARPHLAHRLAWWLSTGAEPAYQPRAISDPFCVLHRCDNPSCVRPEHLFAGTITDNNRDAAAKGHFSTPARKAAGVRNLGIYATVGHPKCSKKFAAEIREKP